MTKTQPTHDIVKKHLKIGPYEVHAVPTGIFGLDGGSMFGTVPKVLWEKSNPPDEKNRIAMEARALLLKSKDRNILIDTGNGSDFIAKYGEKLGSKFAEMYAVDENGPNLISSLKAHGVNPEDVTDVILTHLHFDHAGGATKAENGKIVPTFPKAKYYLQRSNLETAKNPNVREKASYFQANFQPLLDAGVLQFLDGDAKNFISGISLIVSNGHTQGHQVVQIEDSEKQLFYCGDVIPTSSHIRSAWIMGYDLNPLEIIKEKGELLKLSQNKETYFYFEHDPYCDMASVEKINEDYKVKERFSLT
ncbi:MAG: putative metal-dependent hydrolase [Pseudobdellovibrio sp.]|jgi:glyoxylase-like metal-dependent hydrolase (beta-lactamase superfamily II)|nr:putative metal-dependent hydrolase [Pseudobdellovibrio sp.]